MISPPLLLATALACALIMVSTQIPHAQGEGLRAMATEGITISDIQEQTRALGRWEVMPPVGAVALAGLVLAGVRPRLTEYR